MSRKYRKWDKDFKLSAIALAERESVPIAAAKLSITCAQLYTWRAALAPSSAAKSGDSKKAARTFWSDADFAAVAAEWVSLRIADPVESATVLAEKAQRKVFAGRGDLQRDINSVKAVAPLLRAVTKQWTLMLDQPAPAPVAPVVEVQTQIVEVEVIRKLTFQEMLDEVDEPALEALLAAKRIARENKFHLLLQSIAAHGNGNGADIVKPFVPRAEIYEQPSKRTRRIAVIGVPAEQQDLLAAAVQQSQLNVVLRFPDGKDKETVARCDFAIICRAPGASGSEGDRAIGQLGRDKVVLVDDKSNATVIQQVRNILSRQ